MTDPMTFEHEDQFAEWWAKQPLQPDVVLTQWHERKARAAFAAGVAAERARLVEALEAEAAARRHPYSCDVCKAGAYCATLAGLSNRAGNLRNHTLYEVEGAEMQEATEPVGVEASTETGASE